MLWCVITCAVCCVGLGMTVLTAGRSRLRLVQISPRRIFSGCIASTLFLLAGIFATLAITLAR
ncbi:MAG: hypothetical protein WCF99_02875 [Chloroflexales bacterium]